MFLIMVSYINGYYYLLVDLEDCYLFAPKSEFLMDFFSSTVRSEWLFKFIEKIFSCDLIIE